MCLGKLKNKKGFSLLELLLVVAVGAILLLAGLAVYRNVTENSRVNETIRLLNVTKQETQRLLQGEGSYPTGSQGNLDSLLIDANAIPADRLVGTTIRTPYNGDVHVTGNVRTFTISLLDVPGAACIKIGQVFSKNDSDFVRMTVAGTEPATGSGGTYTALGLQNNCRDGVEMVWEFY